MPTWGDRQRVKADGSMPGRSFKNHNQTQSHKLTPKGTKPNDASRNTQAKRQRNDEAVMLAAAEKRMRRGVELQCAA